MSSWDYRLDPPAQCEREPDLDWCIAHCDSREQCGSLLALLAGNLDTRDNEEENE
jgi:hypothetical protein